MTPPDSGSAERSVRLGDGANHRPTVILTGASRGIGHATVKRFSDEGWRIITCSREQVPDDCRRDRNWTHHITCDLADRVSLADFVEEANHLLGGEPLEALVNNAAVSPKRPSRSDSAA